MLKPFGSFSFAVGNLLGESAIGGAGTGASLTAASASGRPCCHDGGGVGACAAGPGAGAPPGAGAAPGGTAGACAEGAGGLTIGCDPGPAPGWAAGGSAVGCCAATGPMQTSTPAASAAANTAREHAGTVMAFLPGGDDAL